MIGDLGFYFISGFVPHLLLAVPLSIAAYVAFFISSRGACMLPRLPSALCGYARCPRLSSAISAFYWGHRWAPEIPFMWRFHSIHHAPEDVYFLVARAAAPSTTCSIRLCGLIPIYLLGLGAREACRAR